MLRDAQTIVLSSQIKDDWPGYSLDLFTYPEHYHDDIDSVYIPHGVVMNRCDPQTPAANVHSFTKKKKKSPSPG